MHKLIYYNFIILQPVKKLTRFIAKTIMVLLFFSKENLNGIQILQTYKITNFFISHGIIIIILARLWADHKFIIFCLSGLLFLYSDHFAWNVFT